MSQKETNMYTQKMQRETNTVILKVKERETDRETERESEREVEKKKRIYYPCVLPSLNEKDIETEREREGSGDGIPGR